MIKIRCKEIHFDYESKNFPYEEGRYRIINEDGSTFLQKFNPANEEWFTVWDEVLRLDILIDLAGQEICEFSERAK